MASRAIEQFIYALFEEVVADRDVLAVTLTRLSTARLQEMRRAVDAELAGRMQPAADLRDGKAGRI